MEKSRRLLKSQLYGSLALRSAPGGDGFPPFAGTSLAPVRPLSFEFEMPELPWVKWFPSDWASDPFLSMCDISTQGVWMNAVNAMLLINQPRISGTLDELCKPCRCRRVQLEAALAELKTKKVGNVREQNGCTIIECRRLLREFKIKELRKDAASKRWCKDDANTLQDVDAKGYATSASASAYASKEGVQGETKLLTETEAIAQCNGPLGIPDDFARYVFGDWDSRDGRDCGSVRVRWPAYVKKRWNREQDEWRQGIHKGQKKLPPPNTNPTNYLNT